jgi:hypothetical protein
VEVETILARWQTPDHRCFRVRGDDGAVYLLRHLTRTDAWEVAPK